MLRTTQSERGQAAAELALLLPLFALILSGMVAFGIMIYTRLALMTAAADCAFNGAQGTSGARMNDLGSAAQATSLSSFSVSRAVTQGRTHDLGAVDAAGNIRVGSISCQAGYPLPAYWVGQHISGAPQFFNLEYTVTAPAQPFKSNWRDDGTGFVTGGH
jgi:hypothetical protein